MSMCSVTSAWLCPMTRVHSPDWPTAPVVYMSRVPLADGQRSACDGQAHDTLSVRSTNSAVHQAVLRRSLPVPCLETAQSSGSPAPDVPHQRKFSGETPDLQVKDDTATAVDTTSNAVLRRHCIGQQFIHLPMRRYQSSTLFSSLVE